MPFRTFLSASATTIFLSAPTVEHDWTGFYGGLQIGTGHFNENYDGTDYSTDKSFSGAQIGYLRDLGDSVLGVELEYQLPRAAYYTFDYWDELERLSHSFALKARLGHDFGGTLLYGTFGAAHGVFQGIYGSDKENYHTRGVLLGVGLEHAITNNLSLAVELQRQRYDATIYSVSKHTHDIATFKMNYRF